MDEMAIMAFGFLALLRNAFGVACSASAPTARQSHSPAQRAGLAINKNSPPVGPGWRPFRPPNFNAWFTQPGGLGYYECCQVGPGPWGHVFFRFSLGFHWVVAMQLVLE